MPLITLLGAIWCGRWIWKSYPRWRLAWRNRWQNGSKFLAIENTKVDRYLLRAALLAVILYVLMQM